MATFKGMIAVLSVAIIAVASPVAFAQDAGRWPAWAANGPASDGAYGYDYTYTYSNYPYTGRNDIYRYDTAPTPYGYQAGYTYGHVYPAPPIHARHGYGNAGPSYAQRVIVEPHIVRGPHWRARRIVRSPAMHRRPAVILSTIPAGR